MHARWFLFISPLGSNSAHSVDDVNDRPNVVLENCRRLTWNVHPAGRKPMLSDSLISNDPLLLYRFGGVSTCLPKAFNFYWRTDQPNRSPLTSLYKPVRTISWQVVSTLTLKHSWHLRTVSAP